MKHPNDDLTLKNGSKVAVVGGGPAGSFFSYYLLELADRMDIEIELDIYEAKDFSKSGPPGCNHCGGIVSESLVQLLSSEGIVLPESVIRRGIQSYTMHLEQGSTDIETPFEEQRIASMFRGRGPKGYNTGNHDSFDLYLLQLCAVQGANIIRDRIKQAEKDDHGVTLITKSGKEAKYDLVVGAIGLNPNSLELFSGLSKKIKPPKTTKTYICEYKLDAEKVDTYFGNSMHVFLLDVPKIKFGALIPKNEYVTLVLLGSDIDKDIVNQFVNSDAVKNLFPDEFDPATAQCCTCYPTINIMPAKHPFDDRVVLVGDSSSSKLYKNGIGAAYVTAKSAAKTALFEGISAKNFKRQYRKECRSLDRDNFIGKLIFLVTTIIQKSPLLKRSLLRQIINEQKRAKEKRKMSSVLWDTFTGSAPYQSIFLRVMHPYVLRNLIGNIIISIFKRN